MAKSQRNKNTSTKPVNKNETEENKVDVNETENHNNESKADPKAETNDQAKRTEDQTATVSETEVKDKDDANKDTGSTEKKAVSEPKAIKDADSSQEKINTPTGKRVTPPMNPFMKLEQERNSKRVASNVPTAADMAEKIAKDLNIDTTADFVLGSIVAKLNNYTNVMAPNTPVENELGARWQGELAKCFFEALAAGPEASLAALRIIELYFREYRAHTFARSHVFRFMDIIRLEQQRLIGFQSLLHLFVELGDRGNRTNKEIQREVNIGKIADAVSDNTDAQVRLVEFLN